MILERRLDGRKARCSAIQTGSHYEAGAVARQPSTILVIGDLQIPLFWSIGDAEPEAAHRSLRIETARILLAQVPPDHLAPLTRGGVHFFKGDPAVGGFYRINSSTINVNAAVYPTFLVTSFLHEIGHLAHFECVEYSTAREHEKRNWLRIGPLRVRKFWRRPDAAFVTPYAWLSPEEDFAEGYGLYLSTLYERDEWVRAAYGQPEICPVCVQRAFVLDPSGDDAAMCYVCDALFTRDSSGWQATRYGIIAAAEKRGMTSP